jgi:hypothetical protein
MSASGYTPISLYYSTTAAAVPVNTALVNGELAINITDGKLFYKDNTGTVQTLASKSGNVNVSSITFGSTGLTPSTATTGAVTVAGILVGANGGTGVNNGSNTITLGGNISTAGAFTTSGAFGLTLTTTALTSVTLPTSGTLVNTGVTTLPSLSSIGTVTSGTWNATIIGATYGGTGVNNGSNTITLGGNLTTSGAFATTLTTTNTTNVTLPTTGTLSTLSGAETFTNKRIDPRVSSVASASSVTPTIASYDEYAFTALAAALTINAPTGTPVDGDKLIFRLLDNGTPQTLSWNATYTVIGTTLPTTTIANKTIYVGCIYNANNTRWDVVAVATQA